MNRISWKSVADNLIAHMSRESMQDAYNYNLRRLNDPHDLMDDFETAAARQTIKYLAECLAEYDFAWRYHDAR